MEQQLQFEEAEKILSWQDMLPGVYKYHNIEHRGTNSYGRTISMMTLETGEGMKMYYAPASLYRDLNRQPETSFIKYEGTQTSARGYEYPVFRFAKWTKCWHNKFLNFVWICAEKKNKRKSAYLTKQKFFCQLKEKTEWILWLAEENDPVLAEVMNMLEVEPASSPAAAPGPDIPSLREQLAILVSTGKCKEAISMNLTHDKVERLEDKDVMKHYKRYETYIGAKTTETVIERLLSLSTKALGMVVWLKDVGALQNELKNVYIITKELSALSGGLALKFGRLLTVLNALLIAAKTCWF